jgi:hypothetical protein
MGTSGFLEPGNGLRIVTADKVSIADAGIGVEDHRIERAQADGPLEVFNPGFGIVTKGMKPSAAVPCPG